MTSRFASLTEQDIEKIVEDKDSQNTKRSTKVAKELFADYVKEKNLREPEEKKDLAQTLKTFYVEARKKGLSIALWADLYVYTLTNKLSVPLTVVTIFFSLNV